MFKQRISLSFSLYNRREYPFTVDCSVKAGFYELFWSTTYLYVFFILTVLHLKSWFYVVNFHVVNNWRRSGENNMLSHDCIMSNCVRRWLYSFCVTFLHNPLRNEINNIVYLLRITLEYYLHSITIILLAAIKGDFHTALLQYKSF